MNEQQFLLQLDQYLQKLNVGERADIRRDFEEYFESGRMEGKTTEEIIASLGSPEKIAEDLLVAYDESDFVQEVVEVIEHSVGYHKIEVDVDSANIILKSTDKEQPYLEVNDKDGRTETDLKIVGDTLVVKVKRQEIVKKFLFITFIGDLGKSDVTLYVPTAQYKKITVYNDNGRILFEDLFADKIQLESDNGRVIVNNVRGTELEAESDNGRVVLTNVHVANITAYSDNGRIIAEHCHGEKINLKSSNGRIELKEVTGNLNARSSNGRIEAVLSKVTAHSRLKTDNGSIKLYTPDKLKDVVIDASTTWGSSTIYDEPTKRYSNGASLYTLHLETSNGKIVVSQETAQHA